MQCVKPIKCLKCVSISHNIKIQQCPQLSHLSLLSMCKFIHTASVGKCSLHNLRSLSYLFNGTNSDDKIDRYTVNALTQAFSGLSLNSLCLELGNNTDSSTADCLLHYLRNQLVNLQLISESVQFSYLALVAYMPRLKCLILRQVTIFCVFS